MPKRKTKDELTDREERFCQEYLVDLKNAQAAVRAGYSKASASERAHDLRSRERVEKRIDELKMERQKRTNIKADMIVKRLWEIANLDPKDLFDDSGRPLPLSKIKGAVRKAITYLKVNKLHVDGVEVGETLEVKFADRMKALEMLGRHLGMFKERVEHSGTIGLAERLEKALKKK